MRKAEPSLRLRAVMLDWAGTTVDHGSRAPVLALQTLFEEHGIHLSIQQIRRDMGLLKRDHIRALLAMPEIRHQWRDRTGSEPTSTDVAALFREFGPLQLESIAAHSALIEGVADTVRKWQSRGLRIGTTTGYTRAMLLPVLEQAIAGGYTPDASVCSDEVPAGRPAPWMLMRNAELLDVYPPECCVKIGDTLLDIEEGRNAGMWTIGLIRSGNMIGCSAEEWAALGAEKQTALLRQAEDAMLAAGADFVADDLPACDEILRKINDEKQSRGLD